MRSLKNKRHLLEATLDHIKNIKAICITETWITTSKKDLLSIEGFNLASSFCRSEREGGGVCILLKNDEDCKERTDISNLAVESIFEICAIELPKINVVLVALYWPDSKRQPEMFYESLSKLLQLLMIKDRIKNIIIGGDFNINILEQNNLTTRLLNLMKNFNFFQLVNEPTRVTLNTSTCIDLVFNNVHDPNVKVSAEVKELGLSDHKGIFISIPYTNKDNKEQWFTFERIFSERKKQEFKLEVSKVNWNTVFDITESVNENYNKFLDRITIILDKIIPKSKIIIKNDHKNTWLTKGLKISCKNKRLLKIFTSQTDNTILNNYYKKYEKLLKKTVANAKKIHFKNKVLKSNNIIKAMWQVVKIRTNKTKKKVRSNIQLNINNKTTNDPLIIANYFNAYFSSVGAPGINPPKGRPVLSPTYNSVFLHPTTPSEVFSLIRKLKSKRSCGFDELPPTLIKECALELSPPLSFIINQSFTQGVVPEKLKITIVKPLHKSGSRSDCNNYRPIALLPTFSKIIESAMYKRIYNFCEKFNIFNNNQNGFRKGRSTTLAVITYVNEILKILNDKKHAIGVLLDMSKAYDRVLYGALLEKLYGVGVRGIAFNWFSSYLRNRIQYVDIEHYNSTTKRIGKKRSNEVELTKSIPQGSVLGCLLFLIYINDLPNTINIPCTLFADDISLIFPSQNVEKLTIDLNSHLNRIKTWLDDHNLEINFNKTKLMEFRPYQKRPLDIINYKFNGTVIENVETSCLLGINLDNNLNWKSHILKITGKLSSFIYALSELKKTTDLRTATCAYHAYAQAWLRYGIILWGNSTDAKNVFILQKKCIRILANIDARTSCRRYFVEYNILTMTALYILEISVFVRNNMPLFPQHTRPEGLRSQQRLATKIAKLEIINSGPHSMAAKVFNALPYHIQNIKDNTLFKITLNKYLIQKCYYSLQEFFSDN